jgi:hypothetical protein
MAVDLNRETRAMILSCLPFPPLPVEVHRVEGDACLTSDITITTTHALIAQCMDACVLKNDPEFNKKRKALQIQVLQEFLYKLASEAFRYTKDDLYHFYCEFSYKHICTFFNKNDRPEIRFLPYGYVVKGDPVHRKIVEYYVAQGIIMDDSKTKTPQEVASMEMGDIFLLIRDRLGHSMTPEELEIAKTKN